MTTKAHTPASIDDPVLTIGEAADYLRIGRSKMFSLLRDGRIRYLRDGRRRLLRRSYLEEYLDALPTVGGPQS